MNRTLRHAALLLAVCATTAMPARAEYRYTPDDVLAAMSTHSALAACIVTGEVGGVGYDAYAVGAAGELGPVQLAPFGLLDDYLRWSGGASPYDPYTTLDYLDYALGRGMGPNWSTYWRCL
jgi:hypothetical protein